MTVYVEVVMGKERISMQVLHIISKLAHHSLVIKSSSLVLACLLVWHLGQSLGIALNENIHERSATVSVSGLAKSKTQGADLGVLQSYSLFGDYQAPSSTIKKAEVKSLPKTRLSLTLNGVVVAQPSSQSLAVITHGSEQNNYGIGEFIDGTKAQLVEVLSDRVVIENQGRKETLFIVGDGKRSQSPARVRANTPPDDEDDSLDLSAIKEKITNDPSTLFQYVRLSQVKKDGAIAGYRLTPGKSPSLFDDLGLERGDVAVRVNGIDLTDPQAMTQVQEMMKSVSEVNLTIERNGQREDIYMQF